MLTLCVGEDTCTNHYTDSEALSPHTGLDDLLRHRLVAVGHDDCARDGHAGSPRTNDDLVLILHRPLLHLLRPGERVPVLLLLCLDTLELADTDTCPCRLVELDTTALGLDRVGGEDDQDGGEGLELDGHGTEGWPFLVGDVTGGESDRETGEDTLNGTTDGGLVVALEFLLSSDLEYMISDGCY